MIQNPRIQIVLILLAVVGSVLAIGLKDLKLGTDLEGGSELIYEVDLEQAGPEVFETANPSEAEVNSLMTETASIIQQRIDPTGTIGASVVRRGRTGLLIELPPMPSTQLNAVSSQISDLGRLEMRIVASAGYEKEEVKFDMPAEKKKLSDWIAEGEHRAMLAKDPTKIAQFNAELDNEFLQWVPVKVEPSLDNAKLWDSRADYLSKHQSVVTAWSPESYNNGVIPEGGPEYLVGYYAINMHEPVWFTGDDLNSAGVRATTDEAGRPAIGYEIKQSKKDIYADWSDEYTNEHSAIMLNGYVESAPVFRGRIPGRGVIEGVFTPREVSSLVKVLKTGSLKVRPIKTSQHTIGATLGQKSVTLGLWSIIVGGICVLLFILYYYKLAGLVAFAAIALNVFLIMGAINFIEATLTLPGIAGLVLTMGMAVDANILIYERIREELKRGKELLQAARVGFERAMVTILDANITTFLAGLVLFNVGVGPIRGFAVTLMIGIVTSVFTAFFVSRLVFHYLLEGDHLKQFSARSWFSNLKFNFLQHTQKALVVSTVAVLAGLICFFSVDNGTKLGLDFTGGAKLKLVLNDGKTAQELREEIGNSDFKRQYPSWALNALGDVGASDASSEYNLKIKLSAEQRNQIEQDRRKATLEGLEFTPPYIDALESSIGPLLASKAFDNASVTENPNTSSSQYAAIDLHFAKPVTVDALTAAVGESYGNNPDEPNEITNLDDPESTSGTNFRVEYNVDAGVKANALGTDLSEKLGASMVDANGDPIQLSDPIPESEEIGGQMVGELRNAAIGSLIVALFLIVMFIRIRFHEYKYGLAAVAALTHDVLITLGAVVGANALGLVDAELNLAMIAAFLTIIGYSINDTIVIFDRVRENLNEQERLGEHPDHRELMNRSINQTLSRTILTTTTTLFVVVVQFIVNQGSGSALEGFSFALCIGLLAGTYSTIFVATPIVLWLRKREGDTPDGSSATQAAA